MFGVIYSDTCPNREAPCWYEMYICTSMMVYSIARCGFRAISTCSSISQSKFIRSLINNKKDSPTLLVSRSWSFYYPTYIHNEIPCTAFQTKWWKTQFITVSRVRLVLTVLTNRCVRSLIFACKRESRKCMIEEIRIKAPHTSMRMCLHVLVVRQILIIYTVVRHNKVMIYQAKFTYLCLFYGVIVIIVTQKCWHG